MPAQAHFIGRVQPPWAGRHAGAGGGVGHSPSARHARPRAPLWVGAQSSRGLRPGAPAGSRSGYTRKPEKVMYLPWLL